ncbi:MAG TPA: hypothetical protein VLJ39_09805, partial [Tepidisphaeraceae bacterium]|nr:hypothetical protein [Tepidisphaeraceae bacterium]
AMIARVVPAAVRILPMSDQAEGFRGRSIEDVQRGVFLRDLPAKQGRWRYRKAGLSADPGTLVLFQFKARVIASAVFLRDEPFERPVRGSAGALYFEPASFRTFEPVDVAGMRKAWPRFRGFGHVKQSLQPEGVCGVRQRVERRQIRRAWTAEL